MYINFSFIISSIKIFDLKVIKPSIKSQPFTRYKEPDRSNICCKFYDFRKINPDNRKHGIHSFFAEMNDFKGKPFFHFLLMTDYRNSFRQNSFPLDFFTKTIIKFQRKKSLHRNQRKIIISSIILSLYLMIIIHSLNSF